LRSCNSCS